MDNLLERIITRNFAFEEETESIFEDIFPILEAIAGYLKVNIGMTEWVTIEIRGEIILMKVIIYLDLDDDIKRTIDIGVPVELMEHGSPEDIVQFLTDIDNKKENVHKNNTDDDVLAHHLLEQTMGKIH